MLELINVNKWYDTRHGRKTVLDDISLRVRPGEKVGILGLNGAGKSTLIRTLSGAELPNSGQVRRGMKLSWPLASTGGFQGSLTGLDNLKFACRVYGINYKDKIDFVQAFSELGDYFREPVKTYSSGMRARLAFGVSLAIDFDCYLIDEVLSVGDARFRKRCREELFEKRQDKAMIMVSHEVAMVKQYCDRAYILQSGKMTEYESIEAALEAYQNM